MSEEFNLSEKICDNRSMGTHIHIEHVKEFIRLLKEDVDGLREVWKRANIIKLIDKLAGEKLI